MTVGKQADLACIDLSAAETQPVHNVLSQLVYSVGRQNVSDVWIAGVRKLREREMPDFDLDGVVAKARSWRARIAAIQR